MIENRTEKINEILEKIRTDIHHFHERYRKGPDLYFYKRVLQERNNYPITSSFLGVNYTIELIYATLVAWDMNARRAKMKYFDEFKENIISLTELFGKLEGISITDINGHNEVRNMLIEIYPRLNLMRTNGRLVSNSKFLHFLFSKLLMPIDGTNTLNYLYDNTGESLNKYLEIIDFTFEISTHNIQWEQYIDNNWNISIPKIIDNAIIMLSGRSLT